MESIREGKEDGLVYLYTHFRKEFIHWGMKRYPVDRDMSSDAFQEAVIALRYNVMHGRLDGLSSTLKTYLFSIGKNQILTRMKKAAREYSTEEIDGYRDQLIVLEREELSDRQVLISKMMKRLEEPCASILKMFYYHGYSMDVIATRMQYKNVNVAKTQKLRCLNKLRAALNTRDK